MDYQQNRRSPLKPSSAGTGPSHPALRDGAELEQAVSKLISERRRRGTYFPGRLFADPAWDILLVLALAATRQHRLSISKVCDRLDLPPTTTLRWMNTLAEEGLLVRRDDVNDKRRKYVELTPHAYAAILSYCTTGMPLPLAA